MSSLNRVRASARSILAVAKHSVYMSPVGDILKEMIDSLEDQSVETTSEHIYYLAEQVHSWFDEHTSYGPGAFLVTEAMPLRGTAEELYKFSVLARDLSVTEFIRDLLEVRKLASHDIRESIATHRPAKSTIFVGHGRNKLYHEVLTNLREMCPVASVKTFESYKIAGLQIASILDKAKVETTIAVMVATGEDAVDSGKRARQNVVHETGFFQGVLGFDRVAILQEEGIQWFSNNDGILVIPFPKDTIQGAMHELSKFIKSHNLC